TGLAASTVTPGRTAPDVSRTMPAMALVCCAAAGRGTSGMNARVVRPIRENRELVMAPLSGRAPYTTPVGPAEGGPHGMQMGSEAQRVFEVLDIAAADDDSKPEQERTCGHDLCGQRRILAGSEAFHPVEDASQVK